MTEVPALTPASAPVELLIVATAGVAEDQVPPVTEEVKVEDPLEQIAVVPEMVPAEVPLLASNIVEVPTTAILLFEELGDPEKVPIELPNATENNRAEFDKPEKPSLNSKS